MVLDTNSIISGLLDNGAPHQVLVLAYKNKIQIWGSSNTYNEFCRVINYPKLEKRILGRYLTIQAIQFEFSKLINICNVDSNREEIIIPDDRDDEEFLYIASSSESKIIISGDHHLLNIGEYKSIRIISAPIFLDCLQDFFIKASNKSIWTKRKWKVWGKNFS